MSALERVADLREAAKQVHLRANKPGIQPLVSANDAGYYLKAHRLRSARATDERLLLLPSAE
jgi:hypothetical protein